MTAVRKNSFRDRKRILAAATLSLLVLIISVLTISSVRAEDIDDDEDSEILSEITNEDYNSLVDEVNDENEFMERLDEIFNPDKDENGNETLLHALMQGDRAPVKAGRDIIMAIGILLVILYTVIQVFKSMQREDQSLETLIRIIFLAIFGVMVVVYSYDIANGLDKLGHTIQAGIRNAVVNPDYDPAQLGKKAVEVAEATEENKNLFTVVGDFLKGVWEGVKDSFIVELFTDPWGFVYSKVVTGITNIALKFTFYAILTSAYGLLFEMIIRKMFIPIAVADLMAEGVRGPAVRYMKNYFGLYVRIAIFYIIVYLLLYIQDWAADASNFNTARSINTVLGPFGVMICVRAAAKALMSATGGLVKEVLGS